MPYKTFLDNAALAAPDLQNYLMNQMVVNAGVGARPSSPPHGMVTFVNSDNLFAYCSNSVGPVWSPFRPRVLWATSTATAATTTTTFVKDTGVGDLGFNVQFTNHAFRIRYYARALSDAAGATVDWRIYDSGGSGSPTTGSTQIAGASMYLEAAGGVGATQLVCETISTFTTGSHTIAGFYGRTGGTGGNVNPGQANNGMRFLTVELLTGGGT